MNPLSLLPVLLSLVTACALNSVIPPRAMNAAVAADAQTKSSKRDVELKVQVARQTSEGNPVQASITLTNQSPILIVYGQSDESRVFRIRVTDDRGGELPLTDLGQRIAVPALINAYSTQSLAPGRSMTRSYDLHRLFKFPGPGKYRVTVSRAINDIRGASSPSYFVLETEPLEFVLAEGQGG